MKKLEKIDKSKTQYIEKNVGEDPTISEVSVSLNISGITTIIKKAKSDMKAQRTRWHTKSFKIDKYIYDHYGESEEFVTGEMSSHFRDQGWTVADISGQLHAKKKSGLLTNRKPNEEEAKVLGKGISIWQATSNFYERLEAEISLMTEVSTTQSEDTTESSDVTELK